MATKMIYRQSEIKPGQVKNLENIYNPHGRSAKYLLCMEGMNDDLIARSWHKIEPEPTGIYRLVVLDK